MALDLKSFAIGKANGGGGGGITVEKLTATENGTYTAPQGKAYTPVNVNVASDPYEKLHLLLSDNITEIISTEIKHLLPRLCRENINLKKVYINNPNFFFGVNSQRAFEGCTSLLYAIFAQDKASDVSDANWLPNYFVTNCSNLKLFVFERGLWQGSTHTNTPNLKTMVITRTDKVQTVAVNAFTNSSIIVTGRFYVPDSLLEAYKETTNWVNWSDNIHGYSEAQIYDNGTTYEIGDVCRHNGKLFAWVNETSGNVTPTINVLDIDKNWCGIAEV